MNEVIVFDTDKNKIIEMIDNVKSVGVHHDFTAISHTGADGEYDVKIIHHHPNVYITSI